MKPILVYSKDIAHAFSDEALNELRQAGYIPIEVNQYSDINIIYPVQDIDVSEVARIALQTIAKSSSYGSVYEAFGKAVIAAALAKPLVEPKVKSKGQK